MIEFIKYNKNYKIHLNKNKENFDINLESHLSGNNNNHDNDNWESYEKIVYRQFISGNSIPLKTNLANEERTWQFQMYIPVKIYFILFY